MSTAATAAAIGIKITAINDASKTLSQISRDMKGLAKLGADTRLDLPGFDANTLNNVSAGFNKIKAAAGGAFDVTGKFIPSLGALTGVGAVAGMAKVIAGWEAFGTRIDLTAQRLGMPVEQLSKLQNVAQMHGASAEAMSSGLAGLQATMADALYARNDQAANTFRNLGIDINKAREGAEGLTSELPRIADATQQMFKNSPNAAARFLDQIGIGRELLFVFKDGAGKLAQYNNDAARMGFITKAQADAARDLQEAQNALGITLKQTGYAFAAEVGPDLIPLLKEVTGYVTGHKTEINAFFAQVGKGIANFFDPESLRATGAAIGGVIDKIEGLATTINSLSENWLVKKMFGADGPARPAENDIGRLIDGNIPGAAAADDWAARNLGVGRSYADQAGVEGSAQGRPVGPSSTGPSALSRTWTAITGWLHGDRHMPFNPNVNQRASAAESWQFWKGKGLPDATIAELLGNEQGESGMNPSERGDYGTAGGSLQWHRDRRDAILNSTGIDVWQEQSHQRQLEASYREMKDRIDAGAGRAWDNLNQPHAFGAGVDSLVDDHERSKDRAGDKAKRRGFAAEYYRMFHDGQAQQQAQAQATPQASAAPLGTLSSDDEAQAAKSARLKMEIIHRNAPAGTQVNVDASGAPDVTVMPLRTERSMPMGTGGSGY